MKDETSFEDLKETFLEYKTKAGNPSYVACFGKTFLDENSPDYEVAKKVGSILVDKGFGVLHGGYIGSMEAISTGANDAIRKDKGKNKYWNIGVPMYIFDADVKRSSSVHLPAAKDISDRKQALVEFCDVCVVLPKGGFGTLLETLDLFHQNQISEKFGGKIKPIIFLGGNWKSLFNEIYKHLDMNKQSRGEEFIQFVDLLDEFKKEIEVIQQALM